MYCIADPKFSKCPLFPLFQRQIMQWTTYLTTVIFVIIASKRLQTNANTHARSALTCAYKRAQTSAHTRIHAHTHARSAHTCTQTTSPMCAYIRAHTCEHTGAPTHTHAHKHAHSTHTHTHVRKHARTHTRYTSE